MTDDNKKENSIIPINSTDLVRVGNSISVTNKLLTESKFQFSGDFKGEQIWKVDGHKMAVRQILLSENILNNKIALISCSEDGYVNMYNALDGNLVVSHHVENNWITSVEVWKYSVFCAGRSGKLFRIEYGEDYTDSEKSIQAHDLIINKIIVSSNELNLATCSWDNTIKVWNPETMELKTSIYADNLGVNDILFINNNETIVSCGKDKKIKIWDINSNIQLGQFDGHKHWVNAIAFNNIKNMLASGSCDNTIKIWDIEKQICLLTIQNEEWINDLVFSPNGDYLVANCYNGISKVFDTKTFQLICEYNEHSKVFPYHHSIKREATNWIYSVVFDGVNKSIYTASVDGSIHNWK